MSRTSPQFYEVMNYPVPKQQDIYRYINEIKESEKKTIQMQSVQTQFSRDTENDLMKSYQLFLSERVNFLKHIPFISQIYLCNSITFNALHPWSDIDLCIITKPWYLWYARLWSWLFFSFLQLKRSAWRGDHSYRFCLSFYIDAQHTDLISLRKQQGDVYLSYRLAHTVLLYTNNDYPDNYLQIQNTKLLSYLPNHPSSQTIFLDIPVINGSSWWKKIIEKIFSTLPGKRLQKIIGIIRWWIINAYKTSKLSRHSREHIIVSWTMLKFYTDKRTLYQHKRKSASNKDKFVW